MFCRGSYDDITAVYVDLRSMATSLSPSNNSSPPLTPTAMATLAGLHCNSLDPFTAYQSTDASGTSQVQLNPFLDLLPTTAQAQAQTQAQGPTTPVPCNGGPVGFAFGVAGIGTPGTSFGGVAGGSITAGTGLTTAGGQGSLPQIGGAHEISYEELRWQSMQQQYRYGS